MTGVVLKRGDRVAIQGQVVGVVLLASENGRSFVLSFDAVVEIKGTGLVALGSMAMAMHADGRYYELITRAIIDLSWPV